MRTALAREPYEVSTPWGPVTGKVAYLPSGARRFAPEYKTCLQIALREDIALAVVVAAAKSAYDAADT
jgi:uncharacterized protein (DUF111 family)